MILEPANIDKFSFEGERTEDREMDLSPTTKDGYVVVITEPMVAVIVEYFFIGKADISDTT